MTDQPQIDVDRLTAFRHELHTHPEVSGDEHNTSARVHEFLKNLQPDEIVTGLGGVGLAAIFKGKSEGKRVLVRAELDALPIHETNTDLPYKSQCDGVGHKCGHDGHMTMIAGLAQAYSAERPERGEVVLLFQPAEETGKGAAEVCNDEKFESIRPDYAFSLHNIPGAKMGSILCKEGAFSSSVESMVIKIKGQTSHAAEPQHAVAASSIMPQIMSYMEEISAAGSTEDTFQRAALTWATAGGPNSYGTQAGSGELHYTLRTREPEKLAALWDGVVKKVNGEIKAYNETHGLTEKNGLSATFESVEPFMANMNHPEAVELVKKAAQANALEYVDMKLPNDWGEDFGYFTNLEGVKGVMFGLGSGKDTPPLHHEQYDFPDELIPKGVGVFHHMVASIDHDM
ncbi:MAG: hypothetical protein CBB87_05000 [Micavibrio sp. TMED27]|nr:hypothetical protein [Micavibrio sp.]OUT91389.1 MAG: hypothetical protein CBB87_05000 [Micavibrio sp. TMED27]|tara:strand:+ start:218 stop:1417 length:1200 start_codon:yes stop_codon:yes gene_type:complete